MGQKFNLFFAIFGRIDAQSSVCPCWETVMKTQYRLQLACLFAGSALLLWSYAFPALAERTLDCLREAQIGVQPERGVWYRVQVFFEVLSPANLVTSERSRLIELKQKIIEFKSQKEMLIAIVEAHMRGNAAEGGGGAGFRAGGGISERLRLSMIPEVLNQTREIAKELEAIARAGSLFAAGRTFEQLERAFDVKYNDLACLQVQTASPTPDLQAVQAILQKLRTELEGISAAEEALGTYIENSDRPSPMVDHQ
jgi:hypothetical protein